jgi:SAM-dependent methyltransferase
MNADIFRLNYEIELTHWWFAARRRILCDLVAEVLPPSPDHVVVDVGCGTGGNIAALAEQYAAVGIDPSREAIELARTRFPRVKFIHGLAPDDLGPYSHEAKLFVLADVLEHVPDDFFLFSHLLHAASPGALFLVTVPAHLSLWSPHDEQHGHYRRYDPERLAHLWKDLPISQLLLSHFNARLYPVIKLVRTLTRWFGRASGACETDLSLPPSWLNRLLVRVFSGEVRALTRSLHNPEQRGYATGASLIALLRKEAGAVPIRSKPDDVAPDHYDPANRQLVAENTNRRAA